MLTIYGLKQHVHFSTHTSNHILDLIITRETDSLIQGKIEPGLLISDHLALMCSIKFKTERPKVIRIQQRKLKNVDINSFKKDILQSDLHKESNKTLDEVVHQYHSTLRAILDKHAPVKEVVKKDTTNSKWYNDDLNTQKRYMRKFERRYMKNKSPENLKKYKKERSELNKRIQNAKVNYYNGLVEETHGNQKALFQLIKKLGRTTKEQPLPKHESISQLSEDFSDFFIDKIVKIREGFTSSTNYDKYDKKETPPPPFTEFKIISNDDAKKLINNAANKSCELDPIPTDLVKLCADELSPVITEIINTSLQQGKMPTQLKHAIIRPTLKKDGLEPVYKNFRPVSNLTFISKLIERVVEKQLNNHIEKNSLDEHLQSAYKSKHSTETVLLKVINDLLLECDNGKVVFLTMLDLSAAFDTVDHKILVQRLSTMFGLSGEVLNWFSSYLTGRSQSVFINNIQSSPKHLNFSVPQGSILGAPLYCKYTVPVGIIIRIFEIIFHMYADDSQLWKATLPNCYEHQQSTMQQLQNCIKEISCWMDANKLKLNDSKTEFMIIGSKKKTDKVQVKSIEIGESKITPSKCVRNLGVQMDSELSMAQQVHKICQACHFHLRTIWSIRQYLNSEATKALVHALITSRLDYCNSVLYGIHKYLITKLQRLQNCAARVIYKKSKFEHVSDLLNDLHWLRIEERIKFKLLVITFKGIRGEAPNYITNLLKPYSPTRTLRSANNDLLIEPRSKLKTYGDRAFSVAAPRLWNQLPKYIKNCQNISDFKRKLKTYMFKDYSSA